MGINLFASHPNNRASLRKWRGERCTTTYHAGSTLKGYGFIPVAEVRILDDDRFHIAIDDGETREWANCIYAFVINDEIVRIGSTQQRLRVRMGNWQKNVTDALRGQKSETPEKEADLWRQELSDFGSGQLWARKGTNFVSEILHDEMSAHESEEKALIRRHMPRLNRSVR
jgi:hypothetical protein